MATVTDTQIAAWHIARHLRAIAALLPRIESDQSLLSAYLSGLTPDLVTDVAEMLTRKALAIEAAAPIPAVAAHQRQAVTENMLDQIADMSTHETIEMLTEDMLDVDWHEEWDQLANQEE